MRSGGGDAWKRARPYNPVECDAFQQRVPFLQNKWPNKVLRFSLFK